ncbi:Dimethylaniline monooxygenase [N-oxide-forming] 5 [Sciurus carolinensis]|uniref:Flavin-containing monooxygenase n=1 Tax=Sciurus carolinensis TaxID=30640 RepID=A0AA41SW52_SCICA|nr:Dimethylaniline monooxygenase [N-oxide-forming] 5 [Sciurus carolinensis]
MTKKIIAVIGSEACGLSSAKCCLDKDLESVCFERTDDIGGLCRYQTTVYSVKKRPDFSSSGQWDVVTECKGKKKANVFDGVMVCTGHHTNAHLPLEIFPVKGNVKEFTETAAIFEDGSREDDIDAVIFATGCGLPLLFLKIPSKWSKTRYTHIKRSFPQTRKVSLAILGLIQTFRVIMSVAELQGHWAIQVFKVSMQMRKERKLKKRVKRLGLGLKRKVSHNEFIAILNLPAGGNLDDFTDLPT